MRVSSFILRLALPLLLAFSVHWGLSGAELETVPAETLEVPEAPAAPNTVEPEPKAIERPAEKEAPAATKRPKKRAKVRAPAAHRQGNERVEIGRDAVVEAGEVVRGDLIVLAGDARIDGTVDGCLVVISGSAEINGEVRDESITVLGSVKMGPEAKVGHDVVVVGGPLEVHPQATIGGQETVVALGDVLPNFVWLQSWLSKGLFLARPFPPQVQWVWAVAGVFLLFYLALTVMFPRPVRACVSALEEQPVVSFFIGILIFVLLGPLLFLLVVSVAGILVIPFLLCALVVAALLGKIAVYSYAGQQVGRQMHFSEASLPLLLLIGAVLFYAIYMVPVLGFAVWGIVTLVGLGAVLLAAFGSFRRDDVPVYVPATAAMAGAGTSGVMSSSSGVGLLPPPVSTVPDVALLPRVGFWRRFFAAFLDFVLLGLLMQFVEMYFLLIWTAYHVAMWTWKGTTIGGIVMGIKVVRIDGQPIDFAVALVRSLSSFFSAFVLFLGFFWAGWDRERQAWHDKIAGTVIVKVPRGVSLI